MKIDNLTNKIASLSSDIERYTMIHELLKVFTFAYLKEYSNELKNKLDELLADDIESAGHLANFIKQLGHNTDDTYIIGLGTMARADYLRENGNRTDAIAHYDKAAAIFLEINHRVGWARTRGGRLFALNGVGTISDGDIDEAMIGFDTLIEANEIIRAVSGLGMAISTALRYLSQYDTATIVFEKSVKLLFEYDLSAMKNPTTSTTATEMLAYQHMLAQNDTKAMYMHGLINSPSGSSWLYAKIVANQGCILFLQGDIQVAKQMHQLSLDWFHEEKYSTAEARQLMNLASIERTQGEHEVAIEHLTTAIDLFKQVKQENFAATAQVAWAEIQLLLNRPKDAIEVAEDAKKKLDPLQFQTDWAHAVQVLGKAYIKIGKIEQGVTLLNQGKEAMLKANFMSNALSLIIDQAEFLLQQQLWDKADRLVADTLRAFAESIQQSPHLHSQLITMHARAKLRLHDLQLAETSALNGLSVGNDFSEIRYQCNVVLGAIYRNKASSLYDLAKSRKSLDAAISEITQVVGRLVADQRVHFMEDKENVFIEAIEVALAQGKYSDALDYLERERASAGWDTSLAMLFNKSNWSNEKRQQLDDLLAKHRQQSSLLIFLQSSGSESASQQNIETAYQELTRLEHAVRNFVEEAQHQQNANENTLVESTDERSSVPTTFAFAVCNQDINVFVIKNQQVTACTLPGVVAEVEKQLKQLRKNIEATLRMLEISPSLPNLRAWINNYNMIMTKLYNILIKPIEHELPLDGEPLIIIPHNFLWSLPIAALCDGESYLVDRFTLSLALSHTSVSSPRKASESSSKTSLIMGCGEFIGIDTEADIVATLLGGEKCVDKDATWETLSTKSYGRCYIHIAAHAAIRFEQPESSYIWLYDGPIHPIDITTLDLSACELATLSACDTNLARTSGGDAQLGLVRAFFNAGASSILATLWQVEDAATVEFMWLFYQEIATGTHAATALQRTQKAVMKSERSHPYFWAGFRLTIG